MVIYRVGQSHIYIRCIHGIFGRQPTNYTVKYGVWCIHTVLANCTPKPWAYTHLQLKRSGGPCLKNHLHSFANSTPDRHLQRRRARAPLLDRAPEHFCRPPCSLGGTPRSFPTHSAAQPISAHTALCSLRHSCSLCSASYAPRGHPGPHHPTHRASHTRARPQAMHTCTRPQSVTSRRAGRVACTCGRPQGKGRQGWCGSGQRSWRGRDGMWDYWERGHM